MASNTIWLKGEGTVKEANAGGAITPGHLVYRSSATAVAVHATAGGFTPPMFALEADFVGKGIATAYATNDRVQFLVAQRGAEIYALVPAAAAAIVAGDLLESNGDGTLRKHTAVADLTDSTTGTANGTVVDVGGAFSQATLNDNFADIIAKVNALTPGGVQAGAVVAQALEAVDNSGGGSPARIKVEIV